MIGLKMRDKVEILNQIEKIMSDDRYWLPPATPDTNAVLALVQVDLEAKVQTLCWVLNITVAEAKRMYKESGKVALP